MAKTLSKEQLSELINNLQYIEDPRVQGRSKHLLIDILVLSVCAILCGVENVTDIEEFGRQKVDWLKSFLELPCGIPSHDTIARVLCLIEPSQLEQAFGYWMKEVVRDKLKSVSVDGKTVNGTERGFNTGKQPLALVSVYAHELGLSLMQTQANSTGTSESKAAKECLKLLDIKDVTVMADAGVASKGLLEQVREQKGNYLVAVKGNHRLSYQEVAEIFESAPRSTSKIEEEGHGRKEKRFCRALSTEGCSETFFKSYPDAKTIFRIKRVREEKDHRFIVQKTGEDGKQYYEKNNGEWKRSEESSYYVSNLTLTAQEALAEVRKHWQIENNLHWVLDVAFKEDDWMVKARRLARSLSAIRKIAFNIIKLSKTKGSVRIRMKRAGWNNEFLEQLLWGPSI